MKKQAFTLVELIVVITILAILATIGFVSFSGYLEGARDTNRIAQLKSMSDALELYRTKKDLPIPDNKVDVQASGTTIAYQGYIGANVLETIEYTEKGLDPKDKTYFSYYLTKDKKYFQLLSFLEEANTDVVASNISPFSKGSTLKGGGILNGVQAVDYSSRYPKTQGKKLGILTDDNNTPIQELSGITGSGYIDLNDVGSTVYKVLISDEETISGSGTTLAKTSLIGSCKRIKQINGGSADGIYIIDPIGDGVGFGVYCDMTTNGGGWTFFGHMNSNSTGVDFFETGTGTYKSSRDDDGTKYSLGVENFTHTEMMVTLDNKDPEISEAASMIAFYKYSEGDSVFNNGPISCQSSLDKYSYKSTILGSYTSGGVMNACNTARWYPKDSGNVEYLVLFDTSGIGNMWGAGVGGNGSWNHDGWWYLR